MITFKDEILENENRRKIYSIIEGSPGIHFRELQRVIDIPLTTLEYHLSYMTRKKIVFGEKEGHYRRYYTRSLDNDDKKFLCAVRQKKMREIVLFVISHQKVKYQALADNFGLPNSTLSFYLKYLLEKDILLKERVGYESIYAVKDEDKMTKLLISYKSSLLDKLVDKTLSAWLESYSGRKSLP